MHAWESESVDAFESEADALAREVIDEIMRNEGVLGEDESLRRDTAYARWVQSSLNTVTRAGLVVDGILGLRSRLAIRAFQQRAGLAADGVVGPLTERALIAAGAPAPPRAGSGAVPAAPGPAPSLPGLADLSALRSNIVRIALGEWERWGRGSIKENDPSIRGVLQDYWVNGAGAARTEPNWWSAVPWSAAFISWVVRRAGGGNAFRYSAGHSYYTHAAKQNRVANNSNPFKAFRITEAAPRPGDLVCKDRGSGATYDTIAPGMSTHCDVVVGVEPGRIATIGGNLSDSVGRTIVTTDAGGRITAPGYFAVIRSGM